MNTRPESADADDAMKTPGGPEAFLREVEKTAADGEAFFLSGRSCYYLRNESGRWITLTVADYKRHLKRAGFSTTPPRGELLSDADNVILAVQNFHDIQYAGPLAGRESAFYDRNGVRFLVTDSPRLIRPSSTVNPTEWPTLRGFFQGLIGQGEFGEAQLTTFYGWLKVSHRGLLDFHDRKRERRPEGQALAIVGPPSCGKSLLQLIITEILGGRAAKVARCVSGGNEFNAEAFAAEHLVLDDEVSSKDWRAREHFAAKLKSIVGSQLQECHRKHQTPVNLEPFWRITISCNDEPEALLVLPPLTVDVEDKLILLRAEPSKFPMPAHTDEEKAGFWGALTGEIEALVTWLEGWEIPEAFRDRRYGVATFHHPEIEEALSTLSPEARLLELIDAVRPWEPGVTWEGRASELEHKLKDRGGYVSREADRLLKWGNACGTYLGRLEKRFPDRITYKRTNSKRSWVIEPPPEPPPEAP